jgi:hypothetical protein
MQDSPAFTFTPEDLRHPQFLYRPTAIRGIRERDGFAKDDVGEFLPHVA